MMQSQEKAQVRGHTSQETLLISSLRNVLNVLSEDLKHVETIYIWTLSLTLSDFRFSACDLKESSWLMRPLVQIAPWRSMRCSGKLS